MTKTIETFDCKGCRGHCYGGYHMDADKEGWGDWLRKSDVLERLVALHDTSLGKMTVELDALIAELSK